MGHFNPRSSQAFSGPSVITAASVGSSKSCVLARQLLQFVAQYIISNVAALSAVCTKKLL